VVTSEEDRRTKAAPSEDALNAARLIAGLRRRRAACVRHWPRGLTLALRRAERARRPMPLRAGRPSAERLPFWLVVPWRLDEAYRSPRSARASFLADALWGQYCLFQCIRLQDDVFDGHTTDLALVYASDQFLIEAERAFRKHFRRSSRFWGVFWQAFESTTQAIVHVDEMQKSVGCDPATLARQYAKVGSVLKIGTTAVCLGHRRPGDLAALGRLADDVAMGDQILDDLEDVADDLGHGRFNYVAQRICGRGGTARSDPEDARRAIARALAVGDGAGQVLGDARRYFDRAAATAEGLRIPALSTLPAAGRRAVDGLARAFHRAQVKVVLAPILAGAQR